MLTIDRKFQQPRSGFLSEEYFNKNNNNRTIKQLFFFRYSLGRKILYFCRKKAKTISIKIEQTKVSDSGLILSNQMERDGDFDQEGLELTCLDLFKVLLYSH